MKKQSKRYLIKPFNSSYKGEVDLECNGENDSVRISTFIKDLDGDGIFVFLPGAFLLRNVVI